MQLKEKLAGLDMAPYRARQIYGWIFKKGITSFGEMTDITKEDRDKLDRTFQIELLALERTVQSKEKGTSKSVFVTGDGHKIESVLMVQSSRTTVCISSQAGCPLKCVFCATGKSGFKRNLSSGEIVSQVIHYISKGVDISNIVFMGMGEPFLNYRSVIAAVRALNSREGMNFGIRRMTVSTCGLPLEIRKLAGEGLEINLSISLNAPNDRTRSELMPINRKFPLKELIKAVKYYIQNTNRRVTFEYVMINGVNDTIKDATELAELLKGFLCHVNLIPFNPVEKSTYRPSSKERMGLFARLLARSGVNATIRKSKGSDIAAACGQLASSRRTPVYLPAGRQGSVGRAPRSDRGGHQQGSLPV